MNPRFTAAIILLPLLAAILLQLPARAASSTDDPTVALLRAKDQALLDAIAPGDRKVWDEALSADAVYVDENGVIMDRTEFLKELERRARSSERANVSNRKTESPGASDLQSHSFV